MPEVAQLESDPVLVKQGTKIFSRTIVPDNCEGQDGAVTIDEVSTSGWVRATTVDAIQHSVVSMMARDAADGPGRHGPASIAS